VTPIDQVQDEGGHRPQVGRGRAIGLRFEEPRDIQWLLGRWCGEGCQ